ncbi:MAG: transcriptional coactivator p15/PC4 family protein [Candidatus Aminicenantes bacterium]|nr:transcriptional coactivator p15/PC4 family protein [Candidatus Aminicenantes bacterium]MDH5705043.1 transcriptional coactivator p15/PC4 family protein [Candidatus Aminicenantes bacterium]
MKTIKGGKNTEMKIFEFKKNLGEKVVIQFSDFKGYRLIDLRIFYNVGEEKEDWRPTTKGISISRDKIPKLKEGVDKALEEWERKKS